MEFFDSHCHLDDDKFNIDREQLIPEIYHSGITKFVNCGYSLESSIKAIELSKKYDYIYSTVGISPNDLSTNWAEDVEKIDEILQNELNKSDNNEAKCVQGQTNKVQKSQQDANKSTNSKIVAIGEIGLDYHYDTDKDIQKQAFIKQINLANKYDLPVTIHTRDAVMDTLDIIKANPIKNKGIFHCCPFNRELIKEGLKLGFYISIAGPITFKNSKNAEEIANLVPIDRLLIETDSPYLAPEPVRGTRNDPRNVKYTAQKIADLRHTELEAIAQATYQNAMKIYRI